MELRQLRYFVAVAEEGNISRAATRIFLTQPALSRQIKALEEEVGQRLLERQAHSVRVTRAGEAMLREARDLLQHADQVLERVRATGKGPCLRVGYAPSLAAGILAVAVENFTQTHPDARVELADLSTVEMLEGLERERLDIAITAGPERGARGIKWMPVVRAAWRLALNRNHPLAKRPHLTPAEIARGPLLIFSKTDYPEYWEMIGKWFRGEKQRPRIGGEYDGVDSLMSAVESGLGIAIVATRAGRHIPDRVELKTLSPAPNPLCIAAGCRADRGKDRPLAVFLEELRNAAKIFEADSGTGR